MKHRAKQALRIASLAATLLAQLLALPAAADERVALDAASAVRDSQAAIGRSVGVHQLLDTQGNPVRIADFRGKPVLVSFIYTGCFQVCPTTTKSLSEAVTQLAQVFGADKFNVISIGFNQPFDSPAAMRAFAAQMRITLPNWHFLSPPPETVAALTREFGFRYVATPGGFDHVLTVSMVDRHSRIYTQVYGDRLSRDKLGEPLRLMLRDAPMPSPLQLGELVERVRILCTVYDPTTGQYRYNYGLIIEIAGGLTFALSVLWYFALEWRTRRRIRRAALLAPPAAAR